MSSSPRPAAPPDVVRRAQRLVLACTVALMLLGLAWELWLAPTGSGTLALKVLPLLPCLPGLLRHRLHTYRALSLLVWVYMLEGLVRSTSEGGTSQLLAGFEVLLCLALFSGCVFYIRRRLGGERVAAP